jgi:hypothetical protein
VAYTVHGLRGLMTREQLITENEALHGLLAHACEALHWIGTARGESDEEGVVHMPDYRGRARDTLAQIKEGVV